MKCACVQISSRGRKRFCGKSRFVARESRPRLSTSIGNHEIQILPRGKSRTVVSSLKLWSQPAVRVLRTCGRCVYCDLHEIQEVYKLHELYELYFWHHDARTNVESCTCVSPAVRAVSAIVLFHDEQFKQAQLSYVHCTIETQEGRACFVRLHTKVCRQ